MTLYTDWGIKKLVTSTVKTLGKLESNKNLLLISEAKYKIECILASGTGIWKHYFWNDLVHRDYSSFHHPRKWFQNSTIILSTPEKAQLWVYETLPLHKAARFISSVSLLELTWKNQKLPPFDMHSLCISSDCYVHLTKVSLNQAV